MAIDSVRQLLYVADGSAAQRVSAFSLRLLQYMGTVGGAPSVTAQKSYDDDQSSSSSSSFSSSSSSSSSSAAAAAAAAVGHSDSDLNLSEPFLLPVSVAVDTQSARVYVADFLDDKISVYRARAYNAHLARKSGLNV